MDTLENTDSYKLSHKGFMHKLVQLVYSNFTARSSKYLPVNKSDYDDKVVWFGLQYFIIDYLISEWNEFFSTEKSIAIGRFKRLIDNYLGKDAVPMSHFEALHDLGYLPILIKSLSEGSRVNIKVPLLTIQNTHPDFAWLTNYLETVMSCELWKPATTATIIYQYRKLINEYALKTTGSLDFTMFQAHDFSFRGMSGRHDAAINGAAFLLSSCGTDTIPAISLLENYYFADSGKEFIATSVPATEHSIACAGTAVSGELESYRKWITKDYPTGIVSLVSDTYDYWNVLTEYLPVLKPDILARPVNALGLSKVVIRPDSGDPVDIICGTKLFGKGISPEEKGSIEILWEIFGGTITDQGYRVLDSHIGLIYGDSITYDIAKQVFERLEQKGFASTNIVFGVGSYTMNYLTRDSLGMAVKATYEEVDGVGYELFKDPITDNGTKKSAKGLLRVEKEGDDFVLYDQQTKDQELFGELKPVFENGKIIYTTSLSEIRNRLWG